jgi:hypothetical protein
MHSCIQPIQYAHQEGTPEGAARGYQGFLLKDIRAGWQKTTHLLSHPQAPTAQGLRKGVLG